VQSPAAGTRLSTTTPVVLDVVDGSAQWIAVPDVLGRDEASAVRAVQAAGLQAVVVHEARSDVTAGRVWRQRPAAGEPARPGAAVEVRISP
jgi:serine/threonine-protein kinase